MAFWERIFEGNKKDAKELYTYDSVREEPLLRKSICTGETAAGFRDRRSGHFKEVMLIRGEEDLQLFMKRCGLKEKPRTEY